jgi:hypothetical protein
MSPRILLRSLVLAALAAALPTPTEAQSRLLAMRVAAPDDAPIAAATGAAPALQLASLGRETYQTFEVASSGATTRVAAACLGREDRVVAGSCVRRAAGGYVSFAGRVTRADGADAVECALDGAEATAAVGIAICLDVPPLR